MLRHVVALVTLLCMVFPHTRASSRIEPRVVSLEEDRVTAALERHDGRDHVGLHYEVDGETISFVTPLDGHGPSLVTVNGAAFPISERALRSVLERHAAEVAAGHADGRWWIEPASEHGSATLAIRTGQGTERLPLGAEWDALAPLLAPRADAPLVPTSELGGRDLSGLDFEIVGDAGLTALTTYVTPETLARINALTYELIRGLDPCDPLVAGAAFGAFGLVVIGCTVGCVTTLGWGCLACAGAYAGGIIEFGIWDNECNGGVEDPKPTPKPPPPPCGYDKLPTPEDPCRCEGCLEDPNIGPQPACCYG